MNYNCINVISKPILSAASRILLTLLIFLFSLNTLSYSQNKIYWAQTGGTDRILRSNFDGSNVEQIVTNLNSPEGIVIDDISGKIYWTERLDHSIKSANLDGSSVQTVVSGLGGTYGIDLDRINGKIYWIEINSGDDFIRRINVNGTNLETVVTANSEIGRGIALDILRGKIYWMGIQMSLADLYRRLGREAEAEKIEAELRKLLVYADSDFWIVQELNHRKATGSRAAN